jgi:signal transduction histidine kinase
MRENFDQRSRIMLESTIDVVNNCLINSMRSGRTKHVQTILDNISKNESVDHIRIFSKDGRILYASKTSEIGKKIQEIAPGHTDLDSIYSSNINLIKDNRVYSVTRPIVNADECQTCHGADPVIAYLDVDTDLTQAERFFHTGSIHMIFLAIAIILILFFGFYFLFNYFINRPLIRFKNALDNVEKGDLDVQLPAKKSDEIGTLETHFNHMVYNLKESKQKIEEMHFEQLQRADKLVTLGELAAEMAHEINNPAGIVMSRTDFIQMDSEKYPQLKKYEEDFNVILRQINKISKITGNILKYSKKLPKEFHRVNLQTVTEDTLNILGPRLYRKKIDIIKKYHLQNPEISGDASQLEQVFTNLVNNAIDSLEIGGRIKILIEKIDENRILWSIEDSGNGMDPNVQEHIFSPFFTTKSVDKGTGLGLYIVKNICKNHNAEITCVSNPGEGTTFTILFPFQEF